MATATEIANAYVALTVKAPGIKGDIEKALGGPEATSATDSAGKSIGNRLMDSIGGIAKTGLIAAGTVAAAGLGAALVKGFQRLNAIDTAQAKLRGLGHDAGTVEQIMTNALASVKGTAFGLGDAAGVAAQAVAAGIKPGKELESVLSTVANSAAAAGTDLGDMGSIFAKAMTQANGVQNDVLSQLADRGIPIYQALADQLGVTAGEVFKLASEGEIGFAQFAAAAEAATGTVAEEMGTTFQGRLDNMFAALGRLGESILGGIFPQMKDGLSGLTDVLDDLMPVAKTFGETLGNIVSFIVENVRWLGPLAAGIGIATAAMVAFGTAMKLHAAYTTAAAAAQGGLTVAQWAFNAAMAANPIGLIITAIGLLIGAIIALVMNWEEIVAWVDKNLPWIGDTWEAVTGAIAAAAEWMWESVLKPVFEAIGAVFTWLWNTIINPIVTLIVNYFRFWAAVALWAWQNVLQPVFAAIGEVFAWLWETIIEPIVNWITDALNTLGFAFQILYATYIKPVWDSIAAVMSTVWQWIDQNVFTPFKTGIDLIAKGFEIGAQAIGKAWDGIKQAAAVPINFVLGTIWNDNIRAFWNGLVGTLGLEDMILPKAPLVQFAQGGVMPGYTPGRDVHQFYSPTAGFLELSGGEAIMRPEFTRAVGGAAGVAQLNAAARHGQAFADGGVLSFAGDVLDNIVGAASVAWEFLTNPAEAIRKHIIQGIIRPLSEGQNIFGKTVAGVAENTLMGFVDMFKAAAPQVKGGAGMGWEAMWNIVKSKFPWANLNSAYYDRIGGTTYHGKGRAIDTNASMEIFNWLAAAFPNSTELIYSPAGGRQLQGGRPYFWPEPVRSQHWDHVHWAMAQGGVVPKLYDQGGWLPHGGIGVNLSGRPERVLSPAESEAYARGATVVQHITTQQTDPRLQARQWAREAERAFASS